MPDVIIVDDETPARRGLRRMLEDHRDVTVLGEAEDILSARDLVKKHKPDVIFVDVEMPGGEGFDLLDSLDGETKVIFVTAHSQHAARAFDVEALDYVLKPVRAERLARALDRVRRACSPGTEMQPDPGYGIRDHITLRDKSRTIIVPLEKVAVLSADGDFTRFSIAGERPFMIGSTLGSYEERLPREQFVRIGRSMIVNILQIESLDMVSRDVSYLKMKEIEGRFQLKRTAAARLREAISGERSI